MLKEKTARPARPAVAIKGEANHFVLNGNIKGKKENELLALEIISDWS